MRGKYIELVVPLAAVSSLVFTVTLAAISAAPSPGQPVLPGFMILVALGDMLAMITLGLVFVPPEGTESEPAIAALARDPRMSIRRRIYLSYRRNMATVLVAIVLVALLVGRR